MKIIPQVENQIKNQNASRLLYKYRELDKAKEKEKRETIIMGLGWLSFSLPLKLLLIAALQSLDLKSRSCKVKVHGIKMP